MEFVRSSPAASRDCSLGPRDQMKQITSYLDASNVYGSTDDETNELRWDMQLLYVLQCTMQLYYVFSDQFVVKICHLFRVLHAGMISDHHKTLT